MPSGLSGSRATVSCLTSIISACELWASVVVVLVAGAVDVDSAAGTRCRLGFGCCDKVLSAVGLRWRRRLRVAIAGPPLLPLDGENIAVMEMLKLVQAVDDG